MILSPKVMRDGTGNKNFFIWSKGKKMNDIDGDESTSKLVRKLLLTDEEVRSSILLLGYVLCDLFS